TYTFVAKISRTKRRAVLVHKSSQYILLSIDLIEKQMNTPNISKNVNIESCLDESDNTDNNLHDLDLTSDNENLIDDNISENESTHLNAKQKDRVTLNNNANLHKKIWLASTIISMHDMQFQMFTTIQEMQTKINELHVNLKISSEDNIKKELK
ncbi:4902_t:CDS:2, partial [Cetraspora pellucida]